MPNDAPHTFGNEHPFRADHHGGDERSCGFEDKCRCLDTTANCSHNYGRLTFVPHLPSRIKHLIFSFNNLTTIPSDFFANVTRITSIQLDNNQIESMAGGAFRRLTRLTTLCLDHNRLNYSQIVPVFLAKNLKHLLMRYMHLGPPPYEFFSSRPMPRLLQIDLTGNLIQHLNFSVFAPLTDLRSLRAPDNRICRTTTVLMPQLSDLHLQANALFDLPSSCTSNGSSLLPRLSVLNFSENRLSEFGEGLGICLPSLRTLALSQNPIRVLATDMFGGERFPSLFGLSLNAIQPIQRIEPFAFRNPTLQTLSLMYCNIGFSDDSVDADCFAGSPRLEHLQLSHNLCTALSDEKFNRLFSSVKNLRRLYLGQSAIVAITKETFFGLTQLRVLYLYRNKLMDIPDGAFDSLGNLTNLTLSNNQLRTVREKAFSFETRKRLESLDVSANPFVCDCDIVWFQQWFVSSPALFSDSYSDSACSNIPDTTLKSFSLNEQACLLSHEICQAVIASVVLSTLTLAACSVAYRYRWHIRLLLAFRGGVGGGVMRRRLATEVFDYDVFVLFAEADLPWVRGRLMPELEGRRGLRLCVHDRDFLPGKAIVSNVADSVRSSKKLLAVFSRHFARSHWCRFELDLCLSQAVDNDEALIVACLGDVASRDLTSAMTAVLVTTTYLQWEEGPDAVASFWDRMGLCLREVVR